MSASGKSFTFKSIDYGGANYNMYVRAAMLPRLPRPRVAIDGYAQSDGSAWQGSTFEHVNITLECAIKGTDTSTTETLVANVAAALAATQEGPGALVLDSHATKQFTARLVSGMDGNLAQNGETFTLEFIADPWPSATSATNLNGSNGGGGITNI